MKRTITIYMKPKEASIDLDSTALVMIDMQRDFLEPRGALWGGYWVTTCRSCIARSDHVKNYWRRLGLWACSSYTRGRGIDRTCPDLHAHKNQRPGWMQRSGRDRHFRSSRSDLRHAAKRDMKSFPSYTPYPASQSLTNPVREVSTRRTWNACCARGGYRRFWFAG